MLKLRYFLILGFLITAANLSFAGEAQEEFKEYLNGKAQEVRETEDPEEKREILDNMFHRILEAIDYAESWPLFSDEERASIASMKAKVEAKHDELNGYNGFEKVADADLDRFANYTVQEIEQAAEYVTISVLTLVLIILVVAILL